MLEGPRTRDPLAAGFPARFHFLVTLWSQGGLMDQIERHAEYYVLVTYSAMEKKYRVVQIVNDRLLSLGKSDRVEESAEGAISAADARAGIVAFPSSGKILP